jgi:hypothetical protein
MKALPGREYQAITLAYWRGMWSVSISPYTPATRGTKRLRMGVYLIGPENPKAIVDKLSPPPPDCGLGLVL